MGLIVGIDLGTTFSAVAKLDETGRPLIVHNTQGENITASVVAFEDAQRTVVGTRARKQLDRAPNVEGRFKRDMGTDKIIKTDWGNYSPTQLSTMVLRKLKEETEKSSGSAIEAAVVTIPANFSSEAREATLAAAKSAGLPVRHIINEPTAAALYFAFSSGTDLAGVYAVFDLGGGTFDVTIIRVDGKKIDVLASEGVSRLGGDDFDQKLIEIVWTKYARATGGELELEDFGRNDAEELKKELSQKDVHSFRAKGSAGRSDLQVTRAELEEAISTQLAQIEMLCESAIQEADISASDIREVILAGGSTRMPSVRQTVTRVFGREPVAFGNPDEIVALGAAIYAAYKADAHSLNPVQKAAIAAVNVGDIANKYFGTLIQTFNPTKQVHEMLNSILIRKGAKLPASTTETFYTVSDGQTTVNCAVTEASSPETDPRFAKLIWRGELGGLPTGRTQGQPIEVTFAYGLNQTMSVSFKDAGTGKVTDIQLSMVEASSKDGFDIEKFTVE